MSPALLLAAALLATPHPTSDVRFGDEIVRRVTFRQTVLCESDSLTGALEGLEMRVALPGNDQRQVVEDLTMDPAPASITTDRFGNRVAVFRNPRIVAGHSWEVSWSCVARLKSAEHVVDRRRLRSLDGIPEAIRKQFLTPGRMYGMHDKDIRDAAARLARVASDPLDLAFRANQSVCDRLTYRNDGRWENAQDVWRNRHGSCSEYNFVFSALCRLNGLPTRYVGATAFRGEGETYEDTIHHRWTEVWLPGFGWYPVDTSRNDGEDGARRNGTFGRTEHGLLVLMKGDGGDDQPLGWGYVASVDSHPLGDARMSLSKRFRWEPVRARPSETQAGN